GVVCREDQGAQRKPRRAPGPRPGRARGRGADGLRRSPDPRGSRRPHRRARQPVQEMRLAGALAGAVLMVAVAAMADTTPDPSALLQGLDKTSARVSKFEAPVDKAVRFGDLA